MIPAEGKDSERGRERAERGVKWRERRRKLRGSGGEVGGTNRLKDSLRKEVKSESVCLANTCLPE